MAERRIREGGATAKGGFGGWRGVADGASAPMKSTYMSGGLTVAGAVPIFVRGACRTGNVFHWRKNKMEKKVKRAAQKGFTLIELLIVIGLLGALTALVLPSLSADREKALADVCDYNQAGTLRTLQQYYDIYGVFPNNLHIGLDDAAGGVAVPGLPAAQATNMAITPTVLTQPHVDSLLEAGITKVAYDYGYNLAAVGTTLEVTPVSAWVNDTGTDPITFNGITVPEYEAGKTTANEDLNKGVGGRMVCFWITPTADWENHKGKVNANLDWTKGAVDLKVSLPGQCPIPVNNLAADDTPDFSYYMAYILAFDKDSSGNTVKAKLIGTSCPEDGILNP
ncbi:MAG: type II secretion system GspH family protein [Planctomycetota bacterium]|nr:type II secretion system GspH family protein [Planctomycetota bacterium]